jgi:hypothetical protein
LISQIVVLPGSGLQFISQHFTGKKKLLIIFKSDTGNI